MNISNIKIYIGVSLILIVILILIIIIPFSKKSNTQQSSSTANYFPTPTSVATSGQLGNLISPTPISIPANFTGALDATLPPSIVNLSTQKQELRSKVPLNLRTFSVDFDYSQDKFTVTLTDPRDQAQANFDSWRVNNYSALGPDQFIIK